MDQRCGPECCSPLGSSRLASRMCRALMRCSARVSNCGKPRGICGASTAAILGKPEPAGRILGAVKHLPDTIGVVPDVDFLARYEDGVAAVRAKLGKRRTADLLVVGRVLSLDQAVDAALALADELSTHARGPVILRDEPGGLSSREREVLRLIAAGQTNAE